LDPAILHQAVDIFYAPEMTAWQLYPHARETLSTLRDKGYRLGIAANYSCDRVFQRTVDFLSLRPYLDLCMTSASVEYRKPGADIFDIVLQQWDVLPYELVVVGDSLKHDISGAIELGALAVQTHFGSEAQTEFDNRRASNTIVPDAGISSLAELPDIVARWTTT
jgi:FMN hydrolase / 5-amino-6-(5-phospho-D-ribitylamino)uracil phosphatase